MAAGLSSGVPHRDLSLSNSIQGNGLPESLSLAPNTQKRETHDFSVTKHHGRQDCGRLLGQNGDPRAASRRNHHASFTGIRLYVCAQETAWYTKQAAFDYFGVEDECAPGYTCEWQHLSSIAQESQITHK